MIVRRPKRKQEKTKYSYYKPRIVRFKTAKYCHSLPLYVEVDTRLGMFGLYPGDLIEIRKRDISTPEGNWLSQKLPNKYEHSIKDTVINRYLVLGMWFDNSIDNEPGLILLPYTGEIPELQKGYQKEVMRNHAEVLWTRHLVDTENGILDAKLTSVPADMRIIYRFGHKHIHEMRQLSLKEIMRYWKTRERVI